MANNYFTWNGVDSRIKKIYVTTQPSIYLPSERVETIDIPGTTGTLTRKEGEGIYSNISIPVGCFIDVTEANLPAAVNDLSKWLRGEGKLSFPLRPNGYYKARVSEAITLAQILRGNDIRSFNINFDCYPGFYLNSGDTVVHGTTGTTRLTNAGNVFSQPLIKITGRGNCTIMCGGKTMLLEDIGSKYGYICIDCAAKVVYSGVKGNASTPLVLLGTHATGDWIELPEGQVNFVVTAGSGASISAVDITPHWRCV